MSPMHYECARHQEQILMQDLVAFDRADRVRLKIIQMDDEQKPRNVNRRGGESKISSFWRYELEKLEYGEKVVNKLGTLRKGFIICFRALPPLTVIFAYFISYPIITGMDEILFCKWTKLILLHPGVFRFWST